MKKIIALSFMFLSFSSNTFAELKAFVGTVAVLEATYMPDAISFQMNVGDDACPANSWMTYNKNPSNNKIVYATLLAATVSGKSVQYWHDGTNCNGSFIYILPR
ncbi:conserved exported hypothetical protein [Gammaproteobacteria bacterium]